MNEKALEAAAMALAEHENANWYAASFNETPDGSYPDDMRQGYFDAAQATITAYLAAMEAEGFVMMQVLRTNA